MFKITKITDIGKKPNFKHRVLIPQAFAGARIKVFATTCAHCKAMRANTIEAVRRLNIPEKELICISNLADIARMGIMTTPSLVVDGHLISSGKVLSVEQIMEVLSEE